MTLPVLLLLSALMGLPGCDDGPPPLEFETDQPAAKKSSVNSLATQAMDKITKKMESEQEAKDETVEWNDKIFVETPNNRDPFRSFVFKGAKTTTTTLNVQRLVFMRPYNLDEIKLIAVISGGVRPLAMFTDPKGKGWTIKRGDFISKSEGRVKQILPDKVIIEIEERTESGTARTERVVELHQKKESGEGID